MVEIIRATVDHLSTIVPLFNSYRVFYGKPSNVSAAQKFLMERFSNDENVIFFALSHGEAVGFTQLYKTFSSVSLQPFYILNDLFVSETSRNEGVGTQLLLRAQEYCIKMQYKGLALETAHNNPAQRLYEKLGWTRDEEFLHYFWKASQKR